MQFILQVAEDFVGPRKEFFCIALKTVKERYFDNGLQKMFSEDYLIIGKLFGMYDFANLILLWHN